MEISEISPAFFLATNKDVYYTWHLPLGERSSLRIDEDGVTHILDDVETNIIRTLTPVDIVGLTITGYLIPPSSHTMEVNGPIFVVDTMNDLMDPYTGEVPEGDITRVTTLRDFIYSFHRFIPGLTIVAQTLYGINHEEWGNRINSIWSQRINRKYPIVGLAFYSRTRNTIYTWHYHPVVNTLEGGRVATHDASTYDISLLHREVPTIDPYYLDWTDMTGHGLTTILWYLNGRWSFGTRLNLPQDISALTSDEKAELLANLLLSPRQRALITA